MKEKVLITGANGSLARRVKENLLSKGYEVVTLTSTRKSADNKSVFYWNVSSGDIQQKALENCQHIIHLSGFGIIKPWTETNKQLMYDSRITAAKLLFEKCNEYGVTPKTFISASAMGYYGHSVNHLCKETDSPSKGWLSDMCVDWENAAEEFKKLASRVVLMRISLLLSKDAGFLQPTALSMRLGVGVVFGKGTQPFEWIHIDDAARFVEYSIENKHVSGPYNMASPQKFSQYEFMKYLRSKIAKYSLLLKLPKWVLSIIFGERNVILIGGCGLSSDKLVASKFSLTYPTLDSVIEKEFKRK